MLERIKPKKTPDIYQEVQQIGEDSVGDIGPAGGPRGCRR